jgi:hypothetical protein
MASRSEKVSAIFSSRLVLLPLCFIAWPAASRAANNCPWLNEATAGGILGGEAIGAFTQATTGQPAVCLFTSDAQGARRTLRITVEVAADAHMQVTTESQSCGPDAAPLKAIGNEALACAADDRKAGPGERAVGRVRDQVFTITLASSQKGDPMLTRDALKAKIYTAAEQVSGNLF